MNEEDRDVYIFENEPNKSTHIRNAVLSAFAGAVAVASVGSAQDVEPKQAESQISIASAPNQSEAKTLVVEKVSTVYVEVPVVTEVTSSPAPVPVPTVTVTPTPEPSIGNTTSPTSTSNVGNTSSPTASSGSGNTSNPTTVSGTRENDDD